MVRETPYGIVVFPSVRNILAFSVVCALFAVGAYQYVQHPHSAYLTVAAYAGLVLFGLGSCFLIGRLLMFRPVLTISSEGIRIEHILAHSPTLPWPSIAAIAVQKRPANLIARLLDQRDLIIVTGDPAAIIDRATEEEVADPNWLHTFDAAMMGDQTIPALYLPMKARKLARLIAERNASEIARYGIAIRDDSR